ncbi:ribosome biogenesis GTPase A [Acetitomaculum ruminis DSM 5522]|uniref:Ribosome biogenesis GTPase A n=1 Tax=Acetitomaculum ruminis DSM 5522 TaxID=1120918 RepID=A0A1I0VNY3_9FIRM|nr:ribosome biogenesis GTPase YlqF [Acetitomaculum ruminis]SFA78021.1 ribosome biogenesis GTPase A [Acetitomaculum ruminis DSM 5522]
MNYQWYPGHMAKAKRQMQEDLKLVDLIIELVDARIPLSSRNPDIDQLAANKPRIVLLNKSDLADDDINELWKKYFEEQGFLTVSLDSRQSKGIRPVSEAVNKACAAKIERDRKRGIKNRPVRAMVTGIPNVGKSTFINSFAKKAATKTGNKPGVTKGRQWIKLSKTVELLDTPGILWPKFDNNEVGIKLGITGSINDDILDKEELAVNLIMYLKENYEGLLADRYNIDEKNKEYDIISEIALVRKCLLKGGEADYLKAERLIIDDFRSGRLGRISLEKPGEVV